MAVETLPPAPDRHSVTAFAGVDDPVVILGTERTPHSIGALVVARFSGLRVEGDHEAQLELLKGAHVFKIDVDVTHLVDHLLIPVLQLQGQGEAVSAPKIVRSETDLDLAANFASVADRRAAGPGVQRLSPKLFELRKRIDSTQTRFTRARSGGCSGRG